MNKKSLSLAIASTLAVSTVLPTFAMAQDVQKMQVSANALREAAGVTESERLALQMIIAAAMVEQKGGDLVKVDQEVIKKYDRLRLYYIGSIPGSVSAGVLSFTGAKTAQASAEYAGPLLRSLQPLLLMTWEGLKASGRGLDALFTALKIDKAFELSSTASEKVYEVSIRPALTLLVNKYTGYSSAFSAVGSSLYGGVFLSRNAQENMSYESVRALLGQNTAMRSRIDGMVNEISSVMDLDASSQAKLKILIYDNILAQAIKNNFVDDSSKYDLDIVQIMADNSLIGSDKLAAVKRVREIAASLRLEAQQKKAANMITAQNVDIALSMAAAIESNINSGKVQDKRTLSELQRLLGALTAKLALIGFNIKK